MHKTTIKYLVSFISLWMLLNITLLQAQDLKQFFPNFNNQNLIGVSNFGDDGAILIFQETNLFGQNEIKVKFVKDLHNISADDNYQICYNSFSKKEEISYLVLEQGLLILTWIDYRNDRDGDLYAQLIDENGILWDSSGVPICTTKGKQSQPNLACDTKKNIYFTWTDFRDDIDGNIYAQKLNLYAEAQWKENGVQILNLSGKQENPKIISDGKGGAYISWMDNSTRSSQIYLQRIDSTAKKIFGEFGKFISKPGVSSSDVKLVNDKNGNAIIIWCSKEEYQKVIAQKINPNGFEKWLRGGKEICQIKTDQLDPSIFYDEKCYIILIKIKNNISYDIYYQTLDDDGKTLNPNGIKVGSFFTKPASKYDLIHIDKDHLIYWLDSRFTKDGYELYGQKISFDGKLFWKENGIRLLDTSFTNTNSFSLINTIRKNIYSFIELENFGKSQLFFIQLTKQYENNFEVLNLSVNYFEGLVKVSWLVINQKKGSKFWLERKYGNEDWVELSEFSSQDYLERKFYSFDDNLIDDGLYLYRVKFLNEENEVNYSDQRTVEVKIQNADNFLLQNSPNPFNNTTVIRYKIDKPSKVRITIFNSRAVEIAELLNEMQEAGIHEITFTATNDMASGIYFYKIEANNFYDVKKMVYAK